MSFSRIRLGRFNAALLAGLIAGALPQGPALAQDEVFQTPSGEMRLIRTEDFETEIHVGDQVFHYPEAASSMVMEQFGDVFLIFLGTGGNACPGYFAWLDTSEGNLTATPSFGTCSDLYEVNSDDKTISVKVQSMVPGEGAHLYVWDGAGEVTETVLGLENSDTPPGADPRGWLGRHPAELLDSADWEALLLNGMTTEDLDALRYAMKLSSGFKEENGWIAAYGYQNLTEDVAAIAIHPEGELLVAVGVIGQTGTLWGYTERDYPESIQTVLDGE